jgi:hypothetical protein
MRVASSLVLAALVGCVAAQAQAGCPNVTVQQQFDIPAVSSVRSTRPWVKRTPEVHVETHQCRQPVVVVLGLLVLPT